MTQSITYTDEPSRAHWYVSRGAANLAAKRLGGTVVTRCVTVHSPFGDYEQHPMVILVNGCGYYVRGVQGRPKKDNMAMIQSILASQKGQHHEQV